MEIREYRRGFELLKYLQPNSPKGASQKFLLRKIQSAPWAKLRFATGNIFDYDETIFQKIGVRLCQPLFTNNLRS